jgi:integrase
MRETLTMNGKPMAPTGPNIKHAHRVIAEIRDKIAYGTFVLADYFPDSPRAAAHGTDATLAQMGRLWLDGKGRLATKTQNQYRNAMAVWESLFGADTPMSQLTHAKVSAKIGRHPWSSAKLLNNYLIVLRGVFALASRELKIENGLDGVENSKHQAPTPDPLTIDEAERIIGDLTAHYSPQVANYYAFAFMTGMRPEEIIGLRWSDIDWTGETIRVERAKTAGEVKPLKTYQSRDVDLTERALAALKLQKQFTFMLDKEIFHNPVTGKPWHDERSQRDHYWQPSLRRLGIRSRRAYQTRHTYATTALLAGANPSYVARQMGHKSAKMLFTVYSKWIDGADRGREKEKMQAVFRGEGYCKSPCNPPETTAVIGRRDWTRTKSRG